jgi:hypothetical protein
MTKKYHYDFSEDQLRKGSERSIDNVKGLLHSAILLLESSDTQQYSLGLYMYAVEEYGKAILLKSYIKPGKDKIKIPWWIFGKGGPTIDSIKKDPILNKLLKQLVGNCDYINAHDAKILIGSNDPPPQCSMITRGIRITSPNTSGKVIDLKSNRRIFILEGVTGSSADTTKVFFDSKRSTFIEIDLKTSCFYMDFDKDNRTWKYDICPDQRQLKANVKRFERKLAKFKT